MDFKKLSAIQQVAFFVVFLLLAVAARFAGQRYGLPFIDLQENSTLPRSN